MSPRWMATLQFLVGTALILVAVLVPAVRTDQVAFGTLIGLGGSLIGNIPKGPLERGRRYEDDDDDGLG